MSNTTTPSVVAIGELLWDMLPDGRKPGGAPANFIYHVAQNGVRGTAVTAVGDDELGRDLVSILADNDVNVAAQVNDYPTGITAVRLDDGGIPEYDVVKGVAWDHIEFTDEVRGLVRGADAICYGTIAAREAWGTRDTIYRMIDAASPDAIRLFDINIRSGFVNKEVITRFLEGATILKINDEELPIVANLFGLDSPGDDIASRQRVMEALAGMFDLDVTILTAGDAYSIVMGRDETSILPTPKVDVVDTVGAGTMMGPMMTWQWMFLCMCVPALIYGVLAFTIPESPRYLVAQGRMDEAAGVLAKIDDAEIDVNGQLAAIRASLSADRKPSFRDLIGSNERLKPVVLPSVS